MVQASHILSCVFTYVNILFLPQLTYNSCKILPLYYGWSLLNLANQVGLYPYCFWVALTKGQKAPVFSEVHFLPIVGEMLPVSMGKSPFKTLLLTYMSWFSPGSRRNLLTLVACVCLYMYLYHDTYELHISSSKAVMINPLLQKS